MRDGSMGRHATLSRCQATAGWNRSLRRSCIDCHLRQVVDVTMRLQIPECPQAESAVMLPHDEHQGLTSLGQNFLNPRSS